MEKSWENSIKSTDFPSILMNGMKNEYKYKWRYCHKRCLPGKRGAIIPSSTALPSKKP
jgi:hypothetical protein